MLISRIHVPLPSYPQPEDIFQSSLHALFPDDTQNSHGNPGDSLIYQSPNYGDIRLHLPAHPGHVARQLFAHYLWNAGALVAHNIEESSLGCKRNVEHGSTDACVDFWNVRDERVLELGAGTALPSIISVHSAASEVCITDHPSSPALACGTIQANIEEILELAEARGSQPHVSINVHEWGEVADDFAREKRNHYSRIIAADCLWMPSQHCNLISSLSHFLSRSPGACALVVAGFHTGRNIVADFFTHFSLANKEDGMTIGLTLAEIYESDMQGVRRAWQEIRPDESKEEANRWCVVAKIVRLE